jgi:NAD(P)H dehydrogenase (quinone)
MKAVIVLAHPVTSSFNHVLCETIANLLRDMQWEVGVLDLYAERFDPVLTESELRRKFSFDDTVVRHSDIVKRSDAVVFIHPDWWSGPPAILKGWIERVFRSGIAFTFQGQEFEDKKKVGLLEHLAAAVVCTSDSSEDGSLATVRRIWTQHIFEYCGIRKFHWVGIPHVHSSKPGFRTRILREIHRELQTWFLSVSEQKETNT